MKCKVFSYETNDACDFHFTTHIRVLDVIHIDEKKRTLQENDQEFSERTISNWKNYNESIQSDFEKNVQHRNQLHAHAFAIKQIHQRDDNKIDYKFDVRNDHKKSFHQKIEKRQFVEKVSE